jgi:hypothetical protein
VKFEVDAAVNGLCQGMTFGGARVHAGGGGESEIESSKSADNTGKCMQKEWSTSVMYQILDDNMQKDNSRSKHQDKKARNYSHESR